MKGGGIGAWMAAGGMIAASAAMAQTAAPTRVVVNGQRAETADRIDRRVYDIKSDPAAQTGTAADVLGKLPSVQVTPAGKVTLRGDPGVTVLIDGKPPAAGNAIVQTLSAADIDRIEVMTNPSAQYAADGAAGIINIVTKKRHPLGLSGSVNARASTIGELVSGGSMVFTQGAWSIDSRLRYVHSPYRGKSVYGQDLPEAESETGGWRGDAENLLGNLNIAYRLDDRSTVTLEGQDYRGRATTTDTGRFTSAARIYDGRNRSTLSTGQRDIEGVYDYNDEKSGAHFTLDADHTDHDNPVSNAEVDRYAGGQAVYGFHRDTWGPQDNLKGDFERDLAAGRELTAGFELDHRITHVERTVYDIGAIAGPEADGFQHAFLGERSLYSAYATYQTPLGRWTVQPGLRVEWQRQAVAADGMAARDNRVGLYPSLHLNRDLSKSAKLKLSYARRVTRPDIADYDPGVMTATPFSRQTGNPGLKPSDTESWEAGYSDNCRGRSTDVTLFWRVTHDLQNTAHAAGPDGIVVDRPVNAGNATYGGLDLTRKAPLVKRWKYTLNATLSQGRVPQAAGGGRSFLSYTGTGVLQYDGAHGDQVQLIAGVTGRRYEIDGYTGATSHVDVTWQHPLTKKVSLVISASDLLGGNRTVTVIDTSGVRSRRQMQPFDQVMRVALAWKFGAKK